MTFTLAILGDDWSRLTRLLKDREENAAVLLTGITRDGGLTLLCRRIVEVAPESYLERGTFGLKIASSGYVHALKLAREDRSAAVFFHTHPGGDARGSRRDKIVDDALAGVFADRTGTGLYASFILGGTESDPRVSGVLRTGNDEIELGHVRVVGERLDVLPSSSDASADARFDRQVRAFGAEGQALLGSLHVGVVGVGGTGSAVCEQLLRLGVGRLTVVDDDVVDESGLTRIHESSADDVGSHKVALVRRLAAKLGTPTHVEAIVGRITSLDAARALRQCDVIFGCTDDHAGRLVLSRLAYWYLLPVFDMGFLVSTRAGAVDGLFGRVTVVQPGTACLVCRNRIDLARAQAETLPAAERQRLAAEGYVPGLDEPAPSVVSFTSGIASLAVSEFLLRLFALGEVASASELIYRPDERSLRTNAVSPHAQHYCSDRNVWGRGDIDPFLGTLWP